MHILLGGSLQSPHSMAAYFEVKGYEVSLAPTGDEILYTVHNRPEIYAIVLGPSVPDIFPNDLVQGIRKRSTAPILLVQSHVLELTSIQRVSLFAAGVNCVLTMPRAPEILAQLQAMHQMMSGYNSHIWTLGDLTIDVASKLVWGGESQQQIRLPRREFDILETLMRNKGKRMSRESIYNTIYSIFDSNIEPNVVESHMSKLRKRLRGVCQQTHIDSQRFIGYLITDTPIYRRALPAC